MRTILFVCSGNTCRSPMAEAIARHSLGKDGVPTSADLMVASAGVHAMEGMPITAETVNSLSRLDIELGVDAGGTSKMLSPEMIRKADLVFCMTAGHHLAVASMIADDPDHLSKIQLLDPEGDLEDPIGYGQAAYDELAGRLSTLIPRRLKEVLQP